MENSGWESDSGAFRSLKTQEKNREIGMLKEEAFKF